MKIKTQKRKLLSKKAGASVGVAIKVLTSVVLGAAMIAGTYGIVKNNVIPTAYSKIESLYEADGFAPGWGFGEATGDPIPFGGIYTVKSTGEIMQGTTANTFPKPATGDTYEFGDYIYTYNKGNNGGYFGTKWSVAINTKVTDRNRSSYGEILSEVAGEPVTHLYQTFKGCTSLTVSPKIPDTIVCMIGTFDGCSSLVESPNLSNAKIRDMSAVFRGCKSMKTYDGSTDPDGNFSNYKLPNTVTSLQNAFNGCKLMVKAPAIPDTVTGEWGMFQAFYNCTSLVEAPTIPNSVTSMMEAFYSCTSLIKAPEIPDKVKILKSTFSGCESLVEGPSKIPKSVTDMGWAFKNCSSLKIAPVLEGNKNLQSSFEGCTSMTTFPSAIPAGSGPLWDTFRNCSSLTGTIEINTAAWCGGCFYGTVKPIILTGTSSNLAEIAASSYRGNVTVAQ